MVFANQAAADLLGCQHARRAHDARPSPAPSCRASSFRRAGSASSTWKACPRGACSGASSPSRCWSETSSARTGEERWLIVRSSPITDPGHRASHLCRQRLREHHRGQARPARESFMAEASRVLASSMDYAETLQRVARLAVPQIADWCAVDLLNESGRSSAWLSTTPIRPGSSWRERLDRGYRPALDEPAGVPEVIRSGQARIYNDIEPGRARRLRARQRAPGAAHRNRGHRRDHRADDRRRRSARRDHVGLLGVVPPPLASDLGSP